MDAIEMEVKASEIQVGDLVVAFNSIGTWQNVRWPITKIKNRSVYAGGVDPVFVTDTRATFRVQRNTYWEGDQTAAEVRLGDIVIGWQTSRSIPWMTTWNDVNMRFTIDGVNSYGMLVSGNQAVVNPKDKETWFRVRRPLATNTRVSASKWNDKCPRCKGNTYVGFLQVEHEGGQCHQ